MDTTANLTEQQKKMLVGESNKKFFYSAFDFLNNHNGWRNGCLHTFLGTTGAGKSTLVRTLIVDAIQSIQERKQDSKILIILSEETRIDFLTEIALVNFKVDLNRLVIFSELEALQEYKQKEIVLSQLRLLISEENISLAFYDNITTSVFYEGATVKEQSQYVLNLKSLAIEKNIPLAVIAHTGAQVSDNFHRLIEPNDIRGTKTLVNTSQFLYIMQRFIEDKTDAQGKSTPEITQTLRVTKHRGQDMRSTLYILRYIAKARVYGCDDILPFSDLKEIFKRRNKL